MIKLIIRSIFLASLFGTVFSQDYNIDHKQIQLNSAEKKYEVSITYPVISVLSENQGTDYKSFYGFNTLVRTRMEAERDSFIVWMNDWEISEFNKEMTSSYEIWDTVMFSSNSIISVFFSVYSYFAGTAHPNSRGFTINYNLENSSEFFLKDLLNAGWETKISKICIDEITRQKKENGIEPDEWVKDGAGPKADNFKVFNITKDGLLITFPTYQVGAYVEGPSDVLIKYSDIKDIINKNGILSGFNH